MGPDTELLLQEEDAVQDAADLEGIVTNLARVLGPRFDLWYVSACSLRPGSTTMTVLASWTVAESVFTAGTEVAASITPRLERQLAGGRAVHILLGSNPESLAEHLMSEQGVRGATLQVVDHDEQGMVFLVLGSAQEDLLSQTTPAFFAGLAAGIRPRVMELAHLSSS
jgi:hypothetical protein